LRRAEAASRSGRENRLTTANVPNIRDVFAAHGVMS
jgi:hypothetical protein